MRIERIASSSTIYYNKELIRFFDFLSSKNILDINLISTRIVRQYFYHAKEKRNLGQSTISKIIAIIKSFFNYLEEEEIIIKNPTRKIRVPKKVCRIPAVMSRYEVDLIIRSVDFAPLRCRKNNVRDKLVLSLLYYTGIRKSELLNLNWTDINLSKSFIIIRRGKGGKDRLISLHKEVTRLLDQYLEKRLPLKTEALIIGEQGRRMGNCSFVNLLKMYFTLSGLKRKGYTVHSFRHYAERLRRKGIDLPTISKLLGHSRLDTTDIYLHVNKDDFKMAVL